MPAKGIDSNYNEYKEFHQREVEAHICASFMEMTGMKTCDGKRLKYHCYPSLIKCLYSSHVGVLST